MYNLFLLYSIFLIKAIPNFEQRTKNLAIELYMKENSEKTVERILKISQNTTCSIGYANVLKHNSTKR